LGRFWFWRNFGTFVECYLPYFCLSRLICLFESDVRWRCFLGKYFVAILVFVGGLSGCSTPSAIVLNDGRELQTLDAPRYDSKSGFYEFRELDGKLQRVNKDQVKTIKDLK